MDEPEASPWGTLSPLVLEIVGSFLFTDHRPDALRSRLVCKHWHDCITRSVTRTTLYGNAVLLPYTLSYGSPPPPLAAPGAAPASEPGGSASEALAPGGGGGGAASAAAAGTEDGLRLLEALTQLRSLEVLEQVEVAALGPVLAGRLTGLESLRLPAGCFVETAAELRLLAALAHLTCLELNFGTEWWLDAADLCVLSRCSALRRLGLSLDYGLDDEGLDLDSEEMDEEEEEGEREEEEGRHGGGEEDGEEGDGSGGGDTEYWSDDEGEEEEEEEPVVEEEEGVPYLIRPHHLPPSLTCLDLTNAAFAAEWAETGASSAGEASAAAAAAGALPAAAEGRRPLPRLASLRLARAPPKRCAWRSSQEEDPAEEVEGPRLDATRITDWHLAALLPRQPCLTSLVLEDRDGGAAAGHAAKLHHRAVAALGRLSYLESLSLAVGDRLRWKAQETLFAVLPPGLRRLRLNATHLYKEAVEAATRLTNLASLQILGYVDPAYVGELQSAVLTVVRSLPGCTVVTWFRDREEGYEDVVVEGAEEGLGAAGEEAAGEAGAGQEAAEADGG
ncbi:hypothetical protein GPECTOR_20g565 [Gonium pectorale]|uniref:Uncharacterized protein n=1 Tax=Gonium pectorale TaxID=33097 RepID=A0A150GIQ8_GONPE|nr:hypothetical protein GPECTOR_20g565 [Gonium pectorale]|eukprot:KXZ49708.1 hypothetical protein GPECTOR_20g565 [Gonium pectorale]